MSDFDAYCKQHFISYCRELSDCCPYCRIAELEGKLEKVEKLEDLILGIVAWNRFYGAALRAELPVAAMELDEALKDNSND